MGSESFINNPPEIFDYRLGLSATPIRQYDEEGTKELIDYFGKICFNFDLEQAIGKCLTEYNYHVHFVELLTDEMEKWRDLTDKILKNQWRLKEKNNEEVLENLLIQRRKILETASGKISILADLLKSEGYRNLEYALIYATDKEPEQLERVNDMLNNCGIRFHQLTNHETSNGKVAQNILYQSSNLFQLPLLGHLLIKCIHQILDDNGYP